MRQVLQRVCKLVAMISLEKSYLQQLREQIHSMYDAKTMWVHVTHRRCQGQKYSCTSPIISFALINRSCSLAPTVRHLGVYLLSSTDLPLDYEPRKPYFNCRKSFGAAHWVAQCWRWKTRLVLFPSASCPCASWEYRHQNSHSSTQSSLGPL